MWSVIIGGGIRVTELEKVIDLFDVRLFLLPLLKLAKSFLLAPGLVLVCSLSLLEPNASLSRRRGETFLLFFEELSSGTLNPGLGSVTVLANFEGASNPSALGPLAADSTSASTLSELFDSLGGTFITGVDVV